MHPNILEGFLTGLIQTDNECVRGGQHPHHPPVQGEGQGQDPALVHVRHGHGPAPHGQSRLYNTL